MCASSTRRRRRSSLLLASLLGMLAACGGAPPSVSLTSLEDVPAPASMASTAGASTSSGPATWLDSLAAAYGSGDGAKVFAAFCPAAQAEILEGRTRQEYIDEIFESRDNPPRLVLGDALTDEQESALGNTFDAEDYLAAFVFDTDDRELLLLRENDGTWCADVIDELRDTLLPGPGGGPALPAAAQVQPDQAGAIFTDEIRGLVADVVITRVACDAAVGGFSCRAEVAVGTEEARPWHGKVHANGSVELIG